MTPRPEKGFYNAIDDLKPDHAFIVYLGQERYAIRKGIEAISLNELSWILNSQDEN